MDLRLILEEHHLLFFPMQKNLFDLILYPEFELSYIWYEGMIQIMRKISHTVTPYVVYAKKKQENLINDSSRSISEAHPSYYSVSTGVLLQGSSGQGVKLTTHFYVVVRLKMTGSLLLLPIHTFMACWLESWLLLLLLVVIVVKIQVLQDIQPCQLVSIYQHLPFKTGDHLALSMT